MQTIRLFTMVLLLAIVSLTASITLNAQTVSIDTTWQGYRSFAKINPLVTITNLDSTKQYTLNWWTSKNNGQTWLASPSILVQNTTFYGDGYGLCGDSTEQVQVYACLQEISSTTYYYSDTINTKFKLEVYDGFGLMNTNRTGWYDLCHDSSVYVKIVYYGPNSKLTTLTTRHSTTQGQVPDFLVDSMRLLINGIPIDSGYTRIISGSLFEEYITWNVDTNVVIKQFDTLQIWVGNITQNGRMYFVIDEFELKDTVSSSSLYREGCSTQEWVFNRDAISCPNTTGLDSLDVYFQYDTVMPHQVQILWWRAPVADEVRIANHSIGGGEFIGYGDGTYHRYDINPSCDRMLYTYNVLVQATDSQTGIGEVKSVSYREESVLYTESNAGATNISTNITVNPTHINNGYKTSVVLYEADNVGNVQVKATFYKHLTQDTTILFTGLSAQTYYQVSTFYIDTVSNSMSDPCPIPIQTKQCGVGTILAYDGNEAIINYPAFARGSIFSLTWKDSSGNLVSKTIITDPEANGNQSTGMIRDTIRNLDGEEALTLISPCGQSHTFLSTSINQITEQEQNQWSIYPNPTRGEATIEYTSFDPSSETSYTVTTITGQVMQQGEVVGNITQISVASLSSGVYLLLLRDSNGNTSTTKLIKQ